MVDGLRRRVQPTAPSPEPEELTPADQQLRDSTRHLHVPGIIPVNSRAKNAFDWFIIILVLYNASFIPFTACFLFDSEEQVIVDYVVDACFFVDIILNFKTAYIDRNNNYVSDPARIARNYLRTWFVIDVLASFPFELFALAAGRKIDLSILALLKLPRLLRLGRLMKKLDALTSANAFRIVNLLIAFTLCAHWVACLWFLLGSQEGTPNWIDEYGLEGVDVETQYVNSLYWAVTTMTTVGFGDITPVSPDERVFASWVFLFGAVIYASIFGNVALLIQSFSLSTLRYRERLLLLQDFFQANSLPASLKQQVFLYMEYMWKLHRGFNVHNAVAELPPDLQTEILMEMHGGLLRRVPIFKSCSESFLRSIVMKLQPQVSLPGDYIIHEGDFGDEMYFVRNGRVEVCSKDGKIVYTTLHEGSFLGEMSLLLNDRRTASVRAITHCNLYLLTRTDFEDVLKDYPEYFRSMKIIAEARMAETNKLKDSARGPASEPSSSNDQQQQSSGDIDVYNNGSRGSGGGEDGSGKKPTVMAKLSNSLRRKATAGASAGKYELGDTDRSNAKRASARNSRNFAAYADCPPYMLVPTSTFARYWAQLSVGMVLYSCILLPYDVAFDTSVSSWRLAIDYVVDGFFWLGVVLTFRTGIVRNYSDVTYDKRVIASAYINSWFPFDVVANFPFELIALAVDPDSNQLFTALRLFRMLRLGYLYRSSSTVTSSLARMGYLLFFFTLVGHWFACIWFILGREHTDFDGPSEVVPDVGCNTSWIVCSGLQKAGLYNLYTTSLYWSLLTMTTVGYGDILPVTNREKLFAIALMLLSAIVYAVIFGNVSLVIQSFDAASVRFREKITTMNEFLSYARLPANLQRHARSYLDVRYKLNHGFDVQGTLAGLSEALRVDVMMHLHRSLVEKVPLFSDVEPAFIKSIVMRLQPQVCLRGDFIIREGDYGEEMFFIKHGRMQVISSEGAVFTVLSDGAFFGEMALLLGDRRSASIRALEHTDLYMLTREDFEGVLNEFPEHVGRFQAIAERRKFETLQKKEQLKAQIAQSSNSVADGESAAPDSGQPSGGASIPNLVDTEAPSPGPGTARSLPLASAAAEGGVAGSSHGSLVPDGVSHAPSDDLLGVGRDTAEYRALFRRSIIGNDSVYYKIAQATAAARADGDEASVSGANAEDLSLQRSMTDMPLVELALLGSLSSIASRQQGHRLHTSMVFPSGVRVGHGAGTEAPRPSTAAGYPGVRPGGQAGFVPAQSAGSGQVQQITVAEARRRLSTLSIPEEEINSIFPLGQPLDAINENENTDSAADAGRGTNAAADDDDPSKSPPSERAPSVGTTPNRSRAPSTSANSPSVTAQSRTRATSRGRPTRQSQEQTDGTQRFWSSPPMFYTG